jgi:hypothetical protein
MLADIGEIKVAHVIMTMIYRSFHFGKAEYAELLLTGASGSRSWAHLEVLGEEEAVHRKT